jgi:two-component system sensor histidine kinase KdpD
VQKKMLRGEKMLKKMDTAAVIERRPQLALIDELAHKNIPAFLREKRYQDVEQILKAGIDIFSTSTFNT